MAVFEDLNGLNINDHTEQKEVGGKKLTYLSWPWAWAEVKKRYPDAHYEIWRDANGLPYSVDPRTGYMVYTSVTIEGITHEMWLPVMNGANKAMKPDAYEYQVGNYRKQCEAATMTDINKTIMRCLVKNLAMFGLGLYIYAGEDLPEAERETSQEQKDAQGQAQAQNAQQKPQNRQKGGSVTTADRLPDGKTEATKPTTEGPSPEPRKGESAGAFISRRIAEMKLQFADLGFDFMGVRSTLIRSGLAKDTPSATMTMDEAKQLMAQVQKFYEDKRAEKAAS